MPGVVPVVVAAGLLQWREQRQVQNALKGSANALVLGPVCALVLHGAVRSRLALAAHAQHQLALLGDAQAEATGGRHKAAPPVSRPIG